ncbi:hypothetical protein BS47DRAFT_1431394 [Hydnum rufescens UP504]|uniref:Uncharacterized protein n=1 Tax=Hydnum rufescens UP504 TaxID=1448309 RepID=A0A9P6AHN8_9AGAM|nr:hypothetical protein BS47DRAFT_1431394 [Hydnum rufescens UP504]
MSHLSQEAVLLWSILGGMLLVFLVWHLWKFDRFNCLYLRSNKDGRNGGFKRLMTYSYLCSIPLLLFYGVTITVIKYCEGYFISGDSVVPLPYALWGKGAQHWITILYVALSLAWALEIVSHLEELNFWLFLLALQAPQNWFKSPYFFTWAIGSILALAGLPATVLATRHDPLKAESWLFFVGSMFDLLITLASLKVLWQFPRFLVLVRNQGADPETMVRLETYSQLNSIRVLFRFLFVIPLFILAVDGIRPGHTHTVNQHMFATDFLAMIAGIGCFVSSMLTLLVFFPRSVVQESGYTVVHPDTLSKA